jgi:hypothetical protein
VEVVFLLAGLISVERYRKVISQRIHYDHHGLVEAFRVPTAVVHISRHKAILNLDGRNGAFGSVLKDET